MKKEKNKKHNVIKLAMKVQNTVKEISLLFFFFFFSFFCLLFSGVVYLVFILFVLYCI